MATLIKSEYMTSYWCLIVTLDLSCRISEMLKVLYVKSHFSAPHPYSGQNFGWSLEVDPWC